MSSPVTSTQNKPFLSHIEGLRGIAILLIVLYHLNADWCTRGYFGVDIFLVISGYLIYKSYLANPDKLTFFTFCKARFTRLFPPVLVLVISYHLISAAVLDSREWVYFCPSGVAVLLGYANSYFDNLMKNYFAADASSYPLLHLWYLSVIIHFYLLFATLFIILKRISPKWRWFILFIIAGLSLFIFKFWQLPYIWVFKLQDDPLSSPPVSAYYWTTGRFWECIAGMLIVYMPQLKNNTLKSFLTILGIISIVLPSFIPLRGAQQNLFAICGTMLIIAYPPTGIAAKFLCNPAAQFIGRISFSLYLWHYLVFYIWKHYTYWHLSTWAQCLYMFGAAIVISWGAWYVVEKHRFSFRTSVICWTATLAATFCVSQYSSLFTQIHKKEQYTATHDHQLFDYKTFVETPYEHLENNAKFTTWTTTGAPAPAKLLYLGDSNTAPSYVLLGDSHAHAYVSGIDKITKEAEISGTFIYSRPLPMCKEDFSLNKPAHHQNMTEQVLNYLSKHPELKIVIATCRWGDEFKHYNGNPEGALRQFCEEIRRLEKKLVLITDNPTIQESHVMWYATFCRINGINPRKEAVECTEESYYKYNGRAIAALEQLEKEGLCNLVHVEPHLFTNGVFKSITPDGELLMHDQDHLTHYGSIYYSQKLKHKLIELLKK